MLVWTWQQLPLQLPAGPAPGWPGQLHQQLRAQHLPPPSAACTDQHTMKFSLTLSHALHVVWQSIWPTANVSYSLHRFLVLMRSHPGCMQLKRSCRHEASQDCEPHTPDDGLLVQLEHMCQASWQCAENMLGPQRQPRLTLSPMQCGLLHASGFWCMHARVLWGLVMLMSAQILSAGQPSLLTGMDVTKMKPERYLRNSCKVHLQMPGRFGQLRPQQGICRGLLSP